MTATTSRLMFRLFWHDCWCPEFFLDSRFHVDYCPRHGYPWRAEAELASPLTSCGCRYCERNHERFLDEMRRGVLHERREHFIDDYAR